MRRATTGALVVAALAAWLGAAGAEGPVTFTADEKALIGSHGPWPVETGPDPGNRVSGDKAAIALGRALFHSPALSEGRDRSCATCHDAARGFTDGRARGRGIARVDRNTMALYNLRLNRWYGWDGKSDSLWAQSIHPILDDRELALTPAALRDRIAGDAALADGYRRVFGTAAGTGEAEQVLVNVAKALAAFQETIVSGRTAFDAFRDAVVSGDAAGVAAYPEDAKRGLRLFLGKGRCVLCHFGPNFTNGEFHDIGLPHFVVGKIGADRVDPGRYGGVKKLRDSRFNLLGPYNDDAGRTTAGFTRHVRLIPRQWGEFRVPSLRNLTETAPYMHDGGKKTLEDVVRHYSELDEERLHQDGEKLLKPLKLTDAEIADLVAFLRTL